MNTTQTQTKEEKQQPEMDIAEKLLLESLVQHSNVTPKDELYFNQIRTADLDKLLICQDLEDNSYADFLSLKSCKTIEDYAKKVTNYYMVTQLHKEYDNGHELFLGATVNQIEKMNAELKDADYTLSNSINVDIIPEHDYELATYRFMYSMSLLYNSLRKEYERLKNESHHEQRTILNNRQPIKTDIDIIRYLNVPLIDYVNSVLSCSQNGDTMFPFNGLGCLLNKRSRSISRMTLLDCIMNMFTITPVTSIQDAHIDDSKSEANIARLHNFWNCSGLYIMILSPFAENTLGLLQDLIVESNRIQMSETTWNIQ